MGLGCSFLPPSIARCYPLSERLTRSRYSWPPGTQSYGPIRPCVVRQARSVGLQSLIRLSRLGVLHRRIKGAVFEQNHGSLTSFWCLSLLLAALLPPPFPTSAFVIGAGVTRYRFIAFVLSFGAGRVCRFALLVYLASVFGRRFVTSMWSAHTLLFLGAFGGVLACIGLLAWLAFRKSESTRAGTAIN